MPTDPTSFYFYLQTGLVAALPVAGALLLAWSAVALYFDLHGRDERRLQERLRGAGPSARQKSIDASLLRRARFSGARSYERWLYKRGVIRRVQKALEQAGLTWSAPKFLLAIGGIALAAAGAASLVSDHPQLALSIVTIFVALPLVLVYRRRQARMKRMIEQLPEVFELIGQALKAGHSLSSGIQVVGEHMPDPAGTEFARMFCEQNLGIKIEDALVNMADRLDLLDVKMFATAVLVQRQSGGNLTEVMDNIGVVIRDRLKVLGQARALTAEGRLSGWVLCLLPIIVFFLIWILNPGYVAVLIAEPKGRWMMGISACFQIIGMVTINRIVNIKV